MNYYLTFNYGIGTDTGIGIGIFRWNRVRYQNPYIIWNGPISSNYIIFSEIFQKTQATYQSGRARQPELIFCQK